MVTQPIPSASDERTTLETKDKTSPPHRRRRQPVRIVSAASLFDGHDAAINIMRRLMIESGAEVVHLGHNRSAAEVVHAAIQEDAQGIALSSYQGGHVEYFKYILDLLRERGASHIKVFGGGGGVIVPEEIKELEEYGVTKIYSPDDGRRLGLDGIIEHLLDEAAEVSRESRSIDLETLSPDRWLEIAGLITDAERAVEIPGPNGEDSRQRLEGVPQRAEAIATPIIGVTGTGGAGKSSLVDELIRRFLAAHCDGTVAVIGVDPSKRRSGGALLGDRIRMNAIDDSRVYMRSLATRQSGRELSAAARTAVDVCKVAGFDLVILETSGIGQGDSEVIDLADISIYVTTREFGAASQLEKIDMLDFADIIVLNKCERQGSADALRQILKQYRRNRKVSMDLVDDRLPVFATTASRFNDPGVDALFAYLDGLRTRAGSDQEPPVPSAAPLEEREPDIIPPARARYLAEISATCREYRRFAEEQIDVARRLGQLEGARTELESMSLEGESQEDRSRVLSMLQARIGGLRDRLDPQANKMLEHWPEVKREYQGDSVAYQVRDEEVRVPAYTESLAGSRIPRVALPRFESRSEVLRFLLLENMPGHFPFTAGVFPFKRTDEDPRRQFAGEGPPERTNRRFHYLCSGDSAHRLSTAFDSVTLYGEDPDERPDIYGKVGESGVSICTLDDMKKLFEGFDLCDRNTSVSMTINGPAPIILAMFLNAAIDAQEEKHRKQGRDLSEDDRRRIREATLRTVRGTVQADILKEDQAQNTCIFGTEFALKLMGDIQEYFIEHQVRNYYSVSISGYHIAEAGANPITQLALTLANGFTYVEYYLSRGMRIDDFAPNLSFFFSNGLDPEYTVLGRVARRIWSVSMRRRFGANERSQKLKYHIQTSGRSLHAQEIDFNDIRTTLQALMAYFDNCNSLHTNAYDEAITTPTEESVRRAMAIQLIISRELGWAKNENPLQGSYIVDELTDLVEEAVLKEFDRLAERGGVLGAMETQYQRGKIQEESMLYEWRKHKGELPIIGVNTFENPRALDEEFHSTTDEITRATSEEKKQQIDNLRAFQDRHRTSSDEALAQLKRVALAGGNVFEELMSVVRVASLGQITRALYEVGGKYRRAM